MSTSLNNYITKYTFINIIDSMLPHACIVLLNFNRFLIHRFLNSSDRSVDLFILEF